MKMTISPRQGAFLAGNIIVTSSIVALPQSLIDLALQNTWLVPILLSLYVFVIIYFSFFLAKSTDSIKEKLTTEQTNWKVKILALLLFIYIFHLLLRDLRFVSGFIEVTLLPLTPLYIITMLIILTSLYITWGGVEVIARFTELYYFLFIGVILFVPISLISQFEVENFEPIIGLEMIPSILQSTFIGLNWVGEIVVLFLIIGFIEPINKMKSSILYGSLSGVFLLFVIIFSQIAVLGPEIVRYSAYPSYTLVQQIRLTDFLDRLDFILVALYFPTLFAKFSLLIYGLNRSLSLISGVKTKFTKIPLSIIAGILSITLFTDKADHFEFNIYTWSTLGLLFQLMILLFMFIIVKSKTMKNDTINNMEKNNQCKDETEDSGQQNPKDEQYDKEQTKTEEKQGNRDGESQSDSSKS
ncbi:endospore germination permease [Evansella sp. AB-rgal1]|uniref:GerAB/ArcD/ProY family transporter n=1 Tax=Evansella sp. AB-rgal1 TaxID=3242696 RepID=UPI00359DF51E